MRHNYLSADLAGEIGGQNRHVVLFGQVGSGKTPPVPVHLQDTHYKGSAKLGHGIGYQYAHDYPNHYVKQQYLPDGLTGCRFYEPSENGYEKKIQEWMKFLRKSQG